MKQVELTNGIYLSIPIRGPTHNLGFDEDTFDAFIAFVARIGVVLELNLFSLGVLDQRVALLLTLFSDLASFV